MNKIFILAGNHGQFCELRAQLWRAMQEEGVGFYKDTFVYVDNHQRLKGFDRGTCWGYRTGTYNQVKDFRAIQMELLSRGSSLEDFIEVEL